MFECEFFYNVITVSHQRKCMYKDDCLVSAIDDTKTVHIANAVKYWVRDNVIECFR